MEIIREHLNSEKYEEALQYVHYLSVTPDMTEIPLKELFYALFNLSGRGPFKKVFLSFLFYFSKKQDLIVT